MPCSTFRGSWKNGDYLKFRADRSRCPVCQDLYKLTKKGVLRRHRGPWVADAGEAPACLGSGEEPEKRAKVSPELAEKKANKGDW
jgi:hypothetical protein